MSMVVGEERLSSVLKEINDPLMAVFVLYRVAMVALISSKLEFIKHGLWKNYSRLGLEPQQIMAFGDSENDVEMLEMAGIAYAMENADDKAKAVATALAPANSQGGVYQVLENWLEKRRMKRQYRY